MRGRVRVGVSSSWDGAACGLFTTGRQAGCGMDLSNLLIGRRLANREAGNKKVAAIEGVPAMGLDGLASSAYGPEAALTILMPAGALGLHVITPVMAAILVLLAM